jgi:hypothetical protein
MSDNGISTHTPKSERRDLKLALAAEKRQANGDSTKPYYRPYNQYTAPGTVSPETGHPWTKS